MQHYSDISIHFLGLKEASLSFSILLLNLMIFAIHIENLNPLINTETYLELRSLFNRRMLYRYQVCIYATASFADESVYILYGGNLQTMHSNVCERQSPTARDAQRRIIVCAP
jgi:hypothetical protein